jgi:O-antigen/teichoic acid export membrane protein
MLTVSNRLAIPNIFIAITVSYSLMSAVLAKRLSSSLTIEGTDRLSDMAIGFKRYCAPIVMYNLVGFFYSFADLWILQRFGGAVQQGFYSVGYRFSAICLVATTSMIGVFWKEIAEAGALGDRERLYYLYRRISRVLCFISAAGACFLIPFSREILALALGQRYEAGWLCLAIMFLYPVYQSLGQINNTYLFATGQTALASKIGVAMMLISIPTSYFLLAAPSAVIPGLGLGSTGLAIKMVVFEIMTVNIFAYLIFKMAMRDFDFSYQVKIISLLLLSAIAIKGGSGLLLNALKLSSHPLLPMVLCASLYACAVGAVICVFPELGGLERGQIIDAFRRLKYKARW